VDTLLFSIADATEFGSQMSQGVWLTSLSATSLRDNPLTSGVGLHNGGLPSRSSGGRPSHAFYMPALAEFKEGPLPSLVQGRQCRDSPLVGRTWWPNGTEHRGL